MKIYKFNRLALILSLLALFIASLALFKHNWPPIASGNDYIPPTRDFALFTPIGGYREPGAVLVANSGTDTPDTAFWEEICKEYDFLDCEDKPW